MYLEIIMAYFSTCMNMYTVKKVYNFPVPSRAVTDQTLPGREKFNYSRPMRVWSVTSRLGTGKSQTFFLQCTRQTKVCDLFVTSHSKAGRQWAWFSLCVFSPQSMRPNYGENLAAVPSSYSADQAVKVLYAPTCPPHYILHIQEPYFIYQGSIATLAGSKIYSFKLYYCENLKTCIAVLLYDGLTLREKLCRAQWMTNKSQNKAVNLKV